MKIIGSDANVYLQQLGNSNTANVSCGLTTSCAGQSGLDENALLDLRFAGNSNALNYTGNGTALTAAVYVTGNGNTLNLEQSSSTGAGQQMLINLTSSDNNTVNVLQSSASMSSLVLAQNGTGGTTFNVSQTGAYSNVANINATAAGGSFNIIQKSR
jgi:hypothetical protein